MMTINPGTYRIRNLSTNKYLTPEGGISPPGRTVEATDFVNEGAQLVRKHSMYLYVVKCAKNLVVLVGD